MIEEYPSLKDGLTLDFLLQKCTTIMPRYYTIASSSLAYPEELHIAISMSLWTMPDKTTRYGMASEFVKDLFKQMQENKEQTWTVKSFIKDSNFVMPASTETPIVCVGPGTGVVPFIGFLQERSKQKELNPDVKLGSAQLFFGCREKDTDFIYRDYLADCADKKILSELHLAFSRPDTTKEPEAKKQYVQHLLEEKIDEVLRLLKEENGTFYICGATKMGNEVQALLKEKLGQDYFKSMQTDKRLLVELWSS